VPECRRRRHRSGKRRRIGQAVAVAAAKVAERCGRLELTDEPTTVVLDHDPCVRPWPLLKVEDY
jgi:hypothetical protein